MLRSLVRDPELKADEAARKRDSALVLSSLAIGFLLSATLVFGTLWASGSALGLHLLSVPVRVAVVACVAAVFMVFDVRSLGRGALCRLTLRRQTPKHLVDQYGLVRGVFVWGFDTGSAFSTVRVTGATWVLFATMLFGLGTPYLGLAYGLAFPLGVAAAIVLPAWQARAEPPEPQRVMVALLDLQQSLKVATLVLTACSAALAVIWAFGQ